MMPGVAEFVRLTKPRPIGKITNGVGIVLSVFPLAILMLLYVYVIRARLTVGHWPYLYHPHSYRFGADLHYALLRPWFREVPLGSLPLPAIVYALVIWASFRSFPKVIFMALLLCSLIFYACVFTDPFKFIDWYMD